MLCLGARPRDVSAQADALPPAEMARFEKALAPLGLSSADLRLPAEDIGLWGGDKYKLRALDFLRADALRCGPYARSISGGLITNKDNLGNLVTAAHSRLDNGVRLGLVADPLEASRKRVDELREACLATALSELNGETVESYLQDPAYLSVPLAVKEAAALVLFTVPEAERDRRMGLTEPILKLGLDPQEVYSRVLKFTINTFEEEDDTTGHEVIDDRADAAFVESLMDSVDWNYMSRASTLLAIATQEAYKLMLPPPAESDVDKIIAQNFAAMLSGPFLFNASTPLGRVSLSGTQDMVIDEGNCLLRIDTGGNDGHIQGSTQGDYYSEEVPDYARHDRILIDLGGDDRYVTYRDAIPAFGSGIFGTGVVIDASGNDSYRCTYAGEGSGIFGTGILYDLAGNDTYESYGNSQGSGTFGAGLLVDLGGDDVYRTYKYGQAYGGARGCGILLDCEGNDQYLANLEDHFNGGLYGPTHHVHFVQGSAYGRRADITDGHSWAGGFGLLCDGAGDDQYVADCYGQGNAYWHSLGMLVDKGGNDVYRAGQYSQASAPHFACGILQDEGGDDRYLISIRQSLAHGRDWSLAWLEDSAGNDWYQGARTTLGCSHVNSISVFWDKLGDDTYIMKGPGLGDSEPEPNGSVRDWLLTLGLFLDGGGQDGYYLLPGDESYEGSNSFSGEITPEQLGTLTRLDFAGDGKTWQHIVKAESAPGYMGIGADFE